MYHHTTFSQYQVDQKRKSGTKIIVQLVNTDRTEKQNVLCTIISTELFHETTTYFCISTTTKSNERAQRCSGHYISHLLRLTWDTNQPYTQPQHKKACSLSYKDHITPPSCRAGQIMTASNTKAYYSSLLKQSIHSIRLHKTYLSRAVKCFCTAQWYTVKRHARHV